MQCIHEICIGSIFSIVNNYLAVRVNQFKQLNVLKMSCQTWKLIFSTGCWKSKSQAGTVLFPCNPMVLLRSLSMNAGFALNLSLTYETRASSASLLAFPASSMRERRVLRQSFLFSSRCSNLHERERERDYFPSQRKQNINNKKQTFQSL